MSSEKDKKKKKKKDPKILEKEMFLFVQALARKAVEEAIDQILKDFK